MAIANDKLKGVYRINDTDFPAPITRWEEQPIASGLNGVPILSSYRLHTWNYAQLESSYAEELYALFAAQQSGNAAVGAIETDPYDASGANSEYGTSQYTDAVILSVGARTRGLPMYDDVTVTFEVYVA